MLQPLEIVTVNRVAQGVPSLEVACGVAGDGGVVLRPVRVAHRTVVLFSRIHRRIRRRSCWVFERHADGSRLFQVGEDSVVGADDILVQQPGHPGPGLGAAHVYPQLGGRRIRHQMVCSEMQYWPLSIGIQIDLGVVHHYRSSERGFEFGIGIDWITRSGALLGDCWYHVRTVQRQLGIGSAEGLRACCGGPEGLTAWMHTHCVA